MFNVFFLDSLNVYRDLTRHLTRMVWQGQRDLFDFQLRAGITFRDAVLAAARGLKTGPGQAGRPAQAQAARGIGALEQQARERARRGLPPPREIYDVHNRNRVDWSTLPEWARPSDPELFEGCSHEG
jgi:hypothetical protein